jgi:hypothetical protein
MRIALHLALLFLAFTFPARAHDIEYDTGPICDTRNQAARLAMLLDGNEHTAITVLNAEGSSASTLAAGLAASRQTSISCWSRSTSNGA